MNIFNDAFGTEVRLYDDVVGIKIHRVGSSGYRHAELVQGEVLAITPKKVKFRDDDDVVHCVWHHKVKKINREFDTGFTK